MKGDIRKYRFRPPVWDEWIPAEGRIFLFLDYDGTLAPIAKSPDGAFIPEENRKILEALKRLPKIEIAIVSGRSLKDIKKRVGIKDIIYAGNHGFEIKGPGISYRYKVSEKYREAIKKIKAAINRKIRSFSGVFLEDKGITLCLHYRMASGKDISAIEKEFLKLLGPYKKKGKIAVEMGKKILEVRPPVNWGKGAAVLWLISIHMRNMWSKGRLICPVFIGDDHTDEDAFKALKNRGVTVKVGSSAGNGSCADYRLKDVKEVTKYLKWLERAARK